MELSGAMAQTKYRPLKKELQKVFGRITRSLKADIMPDAGLVEEFLRLGRVMTSYSGFGDENYPAFTRAVEQLHAACARDDLFLAKEMVAEIADLRGRCHGMLKRNDT